MGLIQNAACDTYQIAGVSVSIEKAIVLHAHAAPAKYQTPKKDGVPYIVPVGKTLRVLGIRVASSTATSGEFRIGHASAASEQSSSAPTGFTPLDAGGGVGLVITPASAGTPIDHPIGATIPAGKYPIVMNGASGAFCATLICVLE